MNRLSIKYSFWILILVAVSTGLRSQDISEGYPVEALQVCTDRTLYITGEKVYFTAIIINRNEISANDFSRILYCELITPDGTSITGGKYKIDNTSAQGCLTIPGEAVTGCYYLKSYTRWMRNSAREVYHYTRLKVINPYKAEVLPGKETPEPANISEDKGNPLFLVSTDKMIYHPREEIKLKIDGDTMRVCERKLSLAVVPAASWDSASIFRDSISIFRDPISAELQYYPDTRSISLSGRLLEDKTGNPVPNALVNLSIIGDKDVMAIRTNATGRFSFALPCYIGNRDIFLCGEDIPGISASVFIDNDFCTKPVNLAAPVFHLTETEKETAYKMAVNQKLTSVFLDDTTLANPEPVQDSTPFYGEPDEILVMEKYIDLPTIEDYFEELLGAVNVRKYEGRKIFRFNSTRTEMTIYDPLVLIDMVAVNDMEKILAMSPRLIGRIELVNAPYIKGNITYGGIISFFSKNNDFAGIDLPSSGTFINYKFLEDCAGEIPAGPFPANLPDSRNTICWNPDVQLTNEGESDIRVTAPDTPGKYIIVLRGIGVPGERVIVMKVIEVNNQISD